MTMTNKGYARRVLAAMLPLALAASITGCGLADGVVPAPAPQSPQLAETGRVYALISRRADLAPLAKAAVANGYSPQDAIALEGLGLFMVPVDLPSGATGLDAITALEKAVPGATVGVNHAYRLQAVQSAQDRRSFANTMLNWPQGGCRARRDIGLIDGGVNPDAPGLAGVEVFSRNFANGTAFGTRHGTDVASILADPQRLRDVRLFSANVIATRGATRDIAGAAQLVQALDWLGAQGVKLVNVSLSGPPNKLLAQASEAASRRGMVLVAAAGNNGATAPEQYPAALPSFVAVTAVDATGAIFSKAVRGTHIDVAAPGVDIFVPTGSGGRFATGTSMAAPFVTARLAAAPTLRRATVTEGTLDLGPEGKDPVFGYGLLQADPSC